MAGDHAKVKKVGAFPIPASLKTASGNLDARVVKITPKGLLAEVERTGLKPGDLAEISFTFPVIQRLGLPVSINENMTMIKFYSQLGGSQKIVHLIELHFQQQSAETLEKITLFLGALNKGTRKGTR